jgi:3'(2'), 5'-bisphosphate nucleotidase
MNGAESSLLANASFRDALARDLADIAVVAGHVALRFFGTDCAVDAKQDGSPVTEADRQTQRTIAESLRLKYPALPICGEEDEPTAAPGGMGEYFLVDPVDGTKEFIRRSTEWTVNIGLVSQGRPVAGAVSVPAQGLVYWGGTAAWSGKIRDLRIEQIQSIRTQVTEVGPLRALCSRDHKAPQIDVLFRRLGIAQPLTAGSSLKMLRIASGEADVYPRFGVTMAWDTAAGHAILMAAGGDLFACDGKALTYDPQRLRNPSFIAFGAKSLPDSIITALRGL